MRLMAGNLALTPTITSNPNPTLSPIPTAAPLTYLIIYPYPSLALTLARQP